MEVSTTVRKTTMKIDHVHYRLSPRDSVRLQPRSAAALIRSRLLPHASLLKLVRGWPAFWSRLIQAASRSRARHCGPQSRSTSEFGSTPRASATFRTVERRGSTLSPVSRCMMVVGLTPAFRARSRCERNRSFRSRFISSPRNLIRRGIVANLVRVVVMTLILLRRGPY